MANTKISTNSLNKVIIKFNNNLQLKKLKVKFKKWIEANKTTAKKQIKICKESYVIFILLSYKNNKEVNKKSLKEIMILSSDKVMKN